MALIACPNCSRGINRAATRCKYCGWQPGQPTIGDAIESREAVPASRPALSPPLRVPAPVPPGKSNNLQVILIVFGIVFGLWALGSIFGGGDKASPKATPTTSLVANIVAVSADQSATPTPLASPTPAPPAPTVTPLPRDLVEVIEVIDGETIKVRFGHGAVNTIRYLGITSPTVKECFGPESAAKNAELVGGRPVQLERGNGEDNRDDLLLRYVWVTGDDGGTRFVSEELVKFGFAGALPSPSGMRYAAELKAAETQAREQKRGLWARCTGPNEAIPTPTPPPLQVGSTLRSDRWEVTILSVQRIQGPLVWSPFGNTLPASGQWYIVRIKLTNISRGPLSPDARDYQLRTADDILFANFSEEYAVQQWALRNGMTNFTGAVAPGISVMTNLAFDINPSAKNLRLTYRPFPGEPFHLN